MKPLFALVEQYRALEQLDVDGELEEEAIRNTLEGLQGEIQVKATNVGAFVLNIEAYAQAAAEAGKELAARAKRYQRRADVMREYLREQLKAAEIKKVEGPQFTLTRKLNPAAVIIEPEAKVGEPYLQAPDPMIDQVVQGVREIARDVVTLLDETPPQLIAEDYLVVKPQELAALIAKQLPPRAPDKKKIAEAIKVHLALCAQFVGAGKETPPFPLPGCRLEQAERLEIKP